MGRAAAFDFAAAPRSFHRQLDGRSQRILTNLDDPMLIGAVWGVSGCDAGRRGLPSTPAHRLGCDFSKTAESLLWAWTMAEWRVKQIERSVATEATPA